MLFLKTSSRIILFSLAILLIQAGFLTDPAGAETYIHQHWEDFRQGWKDGNLALEKHPDGALVVPELWALPLKNVPQKNLARTPLWEDHPSKISLFSGVREYWRTMTGSGEATGFFRGGMEDAAWSWAGHAPEGRMLSVIFHQGDLKAIINAGGRNLLSTASPGPHPSLVWHHSLLDFSGAPKGMTTAGDLLWIVQKTGRGWSTRALFPSGRIARQSQLIGRFQEVSFLGGFEAARGILFTYLTFLDGGMLLAAPLNEQPLRWRRVEYLPSRLARQRLRFSGNSLVLYDPGRTTGRRFLQGRGSGRAVRRGAYVNRFELPHRPYVRAIHWETTPADSTGWRLSWRVHTGIADPNPLPWSYEMQKRMQVISQEACRVEYRLQWTGNGQPAGHRVRKVWIETGPKPRIVARLDGPGMPGAGKPDESFSPAGSADTPEEEGKPHPKKRNHPESPKDQKNTVAQPRKNRFPATASKNNNAPDSRKPPNQSRPLEQEKSSQADNPDSKSAPWKNPSYDKNAGMGQNSSPEAEDPDNQNPRKAGTPDQQPENNSPEKKSKPEAPAKPEAPKEKPDPRRDEPSPAANQQNKPEKTDNGDKNNQEKTPAGSPSAQPDSQSPYSQKNTLENQDGRQGMNSQPDQQGGKEQEGSRDRGNRQNQRMPTRGTQNSPEGQGKGCQKGQAGQQDQGGQQDRKGQQGRGGSPPGKSGVPDATAPAAGQKGRNASATAAPASMAGGIPAGRGSSHQSSSGRPFSPARDGRGSPASPAGRSPSSNQSPAQSLAASGKAPAFARTSQGHSPSDAQAGLASQKHPEASSPAFNGSQTGAQPGSGGQEQSAFEDPVKKPAETTTRRFLVRNKEPEQEPLPPLSAWKDSSPVREKPPVAMAGIFPARRGIPPDTGESQGIYIHSGYGGSGSASGTGGGHSSSGNPQSRDKKPSGFWPNMFSLQGTGSFPGLKALSLFPLLLLLLWCALLAMKFRRRRPRFASVLEETMGPETKKTQAEKAVAEENAKAERQARPLRTRLISSSGQSSGGHVDVVVSSEETPEACNSRGVKPVSPEQLPVLPCRWVAALPQHSPEQYLHALGDTVYLFSRGHAVHKMKIPDHPSAAVQWSPPLVIMPSTGPGFSVTFFRRWFFLIPGCTHQQRTPVYRSLRRSDGSLGQWEQAGSLPFGISHHALAAGKKGLFLLGGRSLKGPLSTVCHFSIDRKGNLCRPRYCLALPQPVSPARCEMIRGRLFVWAGPEGDPAAAREVFSSSVEQNDYLLAWRHRGRLPEGRGAEALRLSGKHLVLVQNGRLYQTPWKATGALNQWRRVSGRLPNHHSVLVLGDQLLLAGNRSVPNSYTPAAAQSILSVEMKM